MVILQLLLISFSLQIINHKEANNCVVQPDYEFISPEQLRELVDESTYCTQELHYACNTGAVEGVGKSTGWFDSYQQLVEYWGGNTGN